MRSVYSIKRFATQTARNEGDPRLPAIFIYSIGWTLADGYPHKMRAADYDDWVTETIIKKGKLMHGLNDDILVLF